MRRDNPAPPQSLDARLPINEGTTARRNGFESSDLIVSSGVLPGSADEFDRDDSV